MGESEGYSVPFLLDGMMEVEVFCRDSSTLMIIKNDQETVAVERSLNACKAGTRVLELRWTLRIQYLFSLQEGRLYSNR